MKATLPIGPFDSGLRGPLSLVLDVEGRTVVDAVVEATAGGRGMKRGFEGADPTVASALASRVCERSAVAHALAFNQALEDAISIEVEEGAAAWRVALAEIERVASHLGTVSAVGRALGDDAVFRGPRRYLAAVRDAMQGACGNRFGFGAVVPGGVHLEGSGKALESVRGLAGPLTRDTRFWESKLRMVGKRLAGAALPYGWLPDDQPPAPAFRASGLAADLRCGETAYGYYRELDCEPVVRSDGRCRDRVALLLEEVRGSLVLADKALAVAGDTEERPPPHRFGKASGVGWAESPEGAVEYRVFLGSEGHVLRARASCAVEGLAELAGRAMQGIDYEDAMVALLSFNLCEACIAR